MGKPSILMINRANSLIHAAKDVGYDISFPKRYNATYLNGVAEKVSHMIDIYNWRE